MRGHRALCGAARGRLPPRPLQLVQFLRLLARSHSRSGCVTRPPLAELRERRRTLLVPLLLGCAVLSGLLALGGHPLSARAESADETAAFEQVLKLLAG